jgi:hypothetical protein
MPQAALDNTIVEGLVQDLHDWVAFNKVGASQSLKRKFCINAFLVATEDHRLVEGFNPDLPVTKLGDAGINAAIDRLHQSLVAEVPNWNNDSVHENEKALAIIEIIDLMLTDVRFRAYATVFGIAAANYVPRFADLNENFIRDSLELPTNLVAPVISVTDDEDPTTDAEFVVDKGTWAGSPTTYTAGFYKNGFIIEGYEAVDVSGANATTLPEDVLSVGDKLRVRVTATNSVGQASALSSEVTIVSGS